MSQIIAYSSEPGRVVGCFGDSITQQSNWTNPFYKLLCRRYPGQISLCNLGIGGNRLLYDSPPHLNGLNGPSGLNRFEHDLLGLEGLTHAILALGTNDIGLPGGGGVPEEEMITLGAYTDAMQLLVNGLYGNTFDPYANDQDWGLYMMIRHIGCK